MKIISRRQVLAGATVAAVGAILKPTLVQAQQGGRGLLKQLQVAKKVRIGLANQPPFSSLNPDGSVSGAAPEITKVIMERLGIPELEGFIGNYGELIPGMQAGRWDFVSAALSITKARCAQVIFADPLIYDGSAIIYKRNAGKPSPKTIGEIAKLNVPFGTWSGGSDLRAALANGVAQANVVQFNDDLTLIDGLLTDRMPYAMTSYSSLKPILQQRKLNSLEVIYPIADYTPSGSSCAFTAADTDLQGAYNIELTAMKASGEYNTILKKYGYETPRELLNVTIDEACARAV